MINKTEKDEKNYLEKVKDRINLALKIMDERVMDQSDMVQEGKEYLSESKSEMDHVEKVSMRESIAQMSMSGEQLVENRKKLSRLRHSPWFGRIDFTEEDEEKSQPIYIGIHSFADPEKNENVVYDWRAPISSMFYDYELGPAAYEAPRGEVEGEIDLKRQYRIAEGEMEMMLETGVNIVDDVLQDELNRAADDKMKTIVATIQRDQNAIIRDEETRNLIIQGVAGSGKTSIALHRIAYLLYSFKDEIEADDILILSPNKVFASYISNVLPELGEENIPEMGVELLANEVLEFGVKFESFFEQVEKLLVKNKKADRERIEYKSSAEFLKDLDKYITHLSNNIFKPHDVKVNFKYLIPKWFFEEEFRNFSRFALLNRVDTLMRQAEINIRKYYHYNLRPRDKDKLRKEIESMFLSLNVRTLYYDFFDWVGKPEFKKRASGSRMEFADVFPFIYLKDRLEGIKRPRRVKHLIIDEMQDYTPVQYAVINRLFGCKKTILGDANQSVNVYSASNAQIIGSILPDSKVVTLNKTYRSTLEIARFTQRVSPNPDLEIIERHGEEPTVEKAKSKEEELDLLMNKITAFEESDLHSAAVICKTPEQAEQWYELLTKGGKKAKLLTKETQAYSQGLIVTSSHMAKGLEFDVVFVPEVTSKNFKNEMDRKMLYIACTRAMHRLHLIHSGKPSVFLAS